MKFEKDKIMEIVRRSVVSVGFQGGKMNKWNTEDLGAVKILCMTL